MLLPFFGNRTRQYVYTLLINKSTVSASAWHVDQGKVVIDVLSEPFEWSEEDPESLYAASDTAIASLNTKAERALLSLPDDWVQGQGIHPKRKPLLRSLTERLELESIGFVVTVEAVIAFLKESSSVPVHTICLAVESDAVIVSIITQGVVSPLIRVGRSGNTQDDFLESCSRLKAQSIPPNIEMIPLSESEDTLSSMKRELEASTWDPQLFMHTPAVSIRNGSFVLSAVTTSGGIEVAKTLPTATVQGETTATPALDFAPVESTPKGPEEVALHAPLIETSPRKKKIIFIAVLFFLLCLSVVLFAFILPRISRASVTITRRKKTVDVTTPVLFDTSVSATESAPLKWTRSTIAVEGEKEVQTTGKTETGDKAHGSVTIFNKTQSQKTFPAGTKLSKGKLTFVTDSEVRVASASAGQNYEVIPGKETVKVTASTYGESGNIDKNVELVIGTFDQSAYIARTESPFSGGTVKTIQSVAAKDQQGALDALLPSLREKAAQSLKSSLSEGEEGILIDDLHVTKKKFSKDIGAEAESLSVSLSASASAIVYQKSDILALLRKNLSTSDTESAVRLTAGEQKKLSNTKIEQHFSLHAEVLPPLDTNQYAQILAGKNQEEARAFLDGQEMIASYSISMSPRVFAFARERLPSDPAKITINLQQ